MANIAIAFAPDPTPFQFDLVPFAPGGLLPKTAVPRGRMSFRLQDETITAKIATNTTSIEASCLLPANFAYVMEYAYCSVRFLTDLDDADHFDSLGQIRFQLGDGQGTRHNQLFSEGVTPIELNAGSTKIWCPVCAYPLPLFNTNANQVTVILGVYDSDAVNATIEGDFSLLASFLQYDIEQVFNLPVNFPLPVQVR